MLIPAFDPPPESESAKLLRAEVRAFLVEELSSMPLAARVQTWNGFDADFSRKVGARGWLGMTWPKHYGGHERSASERYVVLEEMLAAGAPVSAHWFADRQSGPSLLKYGTEKQKRTILPRIAAGECFFCIGMSEAGAGSDLAGVRTKAIKTGLGYVLSGTKLWTTNAHRAHYMILFCRTGEGDLREGGGSQFLVDLSLKGITISPIIDLAGHHHFNEVTFDDVLLPADALIGKEGQGWTQVISELSHERSGPDRFMSSFPLLDHALANPQTSGEEALGRLLARFMVLRNMSRGVAGLLETGGDLQLPAAIVKDLGATFEQETVEMVRTATSGNTDSELKAALDYLTMTAPMFSLRGGTREILRGIIARGLKLR